MRATSDYSRSTHELHPITHAPHARLLQAFVNYGVIGTVVEKNYAKPKVFSPKFYAGLMVEEILSLDLNVILLDKKPPVKSL